MQDHRGPQGAGIGRNAPQNPSQLSRRKAVQMFGAAGGALIGAGLAGGTQAQGDGSSPRIHRVADLSQLQAHLANAQGGEIFELAPGVYDIWRFEGAGQVFTPAITLRPQNPARPPRFRHVDLADTGGIVLEGLRFEYRHAPKHPLSYRVVRISRSNAITLRGCVFHGDVARNTGTKNDGHATAYGLTVGRCRDVAILNCCFSRLMRGMILSNSDRVLVRDNDLKLLRSDGINVVAVQGITIANNYLHDFVRAAGAGDHADMIQFWTNRSTRPTHDVLIQANVLRSGAGGITQSIFMRNEEVDRGRAGSEMFYRNIRIEENVIVNGHLHGITLGEAAGVVVRRNTLLRNQVHVTNQNRSKGVFIPRIRMTEASRDVQVTDNIAAAFPVDRPGWHVAGNLVLQDVTPTRPGYYHRTLQEALSGDPLDLEGYRILAGGPADQPGLGAPRLRPEADLSAFSHPARPC